MLASCGVPGNALAIIIHPSFTITEVVPHFPISPVMQHDIIIIEVTITSDARRQNITNSPITRSAPIPTSVTGVVAVSELRAFLVVL